ncbi:hypothetical protein AB0K00_40190 [Dactylosporangium sp. NPDC049525]|uniref:hypothetical protein n=1 Tax=Dactylosporangium sp. NPDC049525 TaxID=3154730 RepID=UPI00342BF2AD
MGPDAIHDQVEEWDTTGLPPTFRLAREILLRHDDHAVCLTGDLITDGTLTSADVGSWPLFDRLHSQGLLAGL